MRPQTTPRMNQVPRSNFDPMTQSYHVELSSTLYGEDLMTQSMDPTVLAEMATRTGQQERSQEVSKVKKWVKICERDCYWWIFLIATSLVDSGRRPPMTDGVTSWARVTTGDRGASSGIGPREATPEIEGPPPRTMTTQWIEVRSHIMCCAVIILLSYILMTWVTNLLLPFIIS